MNNIHNIAANPDISSAWGIHWQGIQKRRRSHASTNPDISRVRDVHW